MKKSILSLAVVSALLFSCNNAEKKETTDGDTIAVEQNAPATEEVSHEGHSHASTPTFSSTEVQSFVDEYTKFYEDYISAVKSNDVAKLQAFATDAATWGTKSQEVMSKMTAEDIQKWSEYAQKMSADLQAAMTK